VLGDAIDGVTKSIPVSSTISHLYHLHDALSQDTDVCCRWGFVLCMLVVTMADR
jgi:hypothetical protein